MVDSNDIDTLSPELDNRLDDLFDENSFLLPAKQDDEQKEHYPLSELKNLILSIDWEITDEVLDNLLLQLKHLQLTYQNDKIVMTFLQILNSLGNYIKMQGAQANPKSFKILNSVFTSLDKVVLTEDMAETAKKKILRAEMNRYKELRAQIAKGKTAALKRTVKAKPVLVDAPVIAIDPPPATFEDTGHEVQPAIYQKPVRDEAVMTLAEAVEEIKRYIHAEINTLKEEIQSLREQK